MNETLYERAILALDSLRRGWWIVALTVGLVSALAFALVKTTPHRFTTSTTILLKNANQASWVPGGTQFPDQNAVEQVRAIEVWLKSDYVLEDLIPLLAETSEPLSARRRTEEMTKLRAALRLVPVGNSMMRLEFDGPRPDGLSGKLEIILSNFLERLLRSDDGVLSASQLVLLRRGEEAEKAEKSLVETIQAVGLDPNVVLRQLNELRRMTSGRAEPSANGTKRPAQPGPDAVPPPFPTEQQIRSSISPHIEIVRKIEHLYTNALLARNHLERIQSSFAQNKSTYVRIFESPENLTIIGRPRDPMTGENPMRKVGIAMILLSFPLGAALALLADMMSGRLRARSEFETLSELPVIARLKRIPA